MKGQFSHNSYFTPTSTLHTLELWPRVDEHCVYWVFISSILCPSCLCVCLLPFVSVWKLWPEKIRSCSDTLMTFLVSFAASLLFSSLVAHFAFIGVDVYGFARRPCYESLSNVGMKLEVFYHSAQLASLPPSPQRFIWLWCLEVWYETKWRTKCQISDSLASHLDSFMQTRLGAILLRTL